MAQMFKRTKEIEAIRSDYNRLIGELQSAGHEVKPTKSRRILFRPIESSGVKWGGVRLPPKIEFIPAKHVHLPTYYERSCAKAEDVANLMERMHGLSRQKFISDSGLERAFANLAGIFAVMLRPDETYELKPNEAVDKAIMRLPRSQAIPLMEAQNEELGRLIALDRRMLDLTDRLEAKGVLSPLKGRRLLGEMARQKLRALFSRKPKPKP